MKDAHFSRCLVLMTVAVMGCSAPVSDHDVADLDSIDDSAFQPAQWCPVEQEELELSHIIPVPDHLLEWGKVISIPLATYRFINESGIQELDDWLLKAKPGRHFTSVDEQATLNIWFQSTANWQSVASTCGFQNEFIEGAYYLKVKQEYTGISVSIFASDIAGYRNGFATLKQLIHDQPPSIQTAAILDKPATNLRGVYEGFYGAPWSWENRLEVLPYLADLKYNYFVLAAKDFHPINLAWSIPFEPEELAHLKDFAEAALANGIYPCLSMHPAFLMEFSNPECFEQLMSKYQAAGDVGFNCFIMAFDDIPKEFFRDDYAFYSTFVEGQVDFANRVGAALASEYPGALLGFVPTDYHTGAEDLETDLEYVGQHLDIIWEIGWTGPDIVSRTITAADADEFAKYAHRAPFLGDNHPVVDNPHKSGIVHLAALTGRSPDLPQHIRGLFFNPMPYPWASLPALATTADYAWNSKAYDPDRSLFAASQWLAGRAAAQSFETFCKTNGSTFISDSVAPDLEAAITAYESSYKTDPVKNGEASLRLRGIFEEYIAIPKTLDESALPAPMVKELGPWIDKLARYGTAGLTALDLLESEDPPQAEALETAISELAKMKAKPTGKIMPDFLNWALSMQP